MTAGSAIGGDVADDARKAEIDADRQAQQIVAQVAVTEAMIRKQLEEDAASDLAGTVVAAQKEIAKIYIEAWAEAEKLRMAEEVQSFARPTAAAAPASYGPDPAYGTSSSQA